MNLHLESKDILQIDVTIIAGILILLSISSSFPELARVASEGGGNPAVAGNPKTFASLVIFAFSASGLIELIKILIQKEAEKLGKKGRYVYENLSIWFMILGFTGLAIFGLLLRVGSPI